MIVVVILIMTATAGIGGCSGCVSYGNEPNNISYSTYQRVPLEKSLSNSTGGWYEDHNTGADRWVQRSSYVTQGLEYFFDKTGVRPYLLIMTYDESIAFVELTNSDRNAQLQAYYAERFTDEAHVLFVVCDDGNGNGYVYDWIGGLATTVMDDEAMDIFYQYMNHYWVTADTEDDLFYYAFTKSADRIMTVGNNTGQKISTAQWIIVGAIIGTVIIVIVVVIAIKKGKERKLREMQLTKDILNTPIEQLQQNQEHLPWEK